MPVYVGEGTCGEWNGGGVGRRWRGRTSPYRLVMSKFHSVSCRPVAHSRNTASHMASAAQSRTGGAVGLASGAPWHAAWCSMAGRNGMALGDAAALPARMCRPDPGKWAQTIGSRKHIVGLATPSPPDKAPRLNQLLEVPLRGPRRQQQFIPTHGNRQSATFHA